MLNPMHILFLSHYFPPEVNAPATRTYEHSRVWARRGHKVTVLTCAPNHPKGKVYSGYRNCLYAWEEIGAVRVLRVWTIISANKGFLKRTLNYVSYMISAIVAAAFLPRPEVVVSTSPQFFNGLAGYVVSRIKRVPWVLEIRDIWPESIRVVGAIRSQRIIRVLERMELFAYRKAERIVVVTDAFRAYMIGKGVESGKIDVIKNGVDLSFYRPVEKNNPLTEKLGLKGKFIVSYFGTHGMAHHLETVLLAARQLRDQADIVFLLVGDGAEKERLAALRTEWALENVIMLDQQPKANMRYLLGLSSASLVVLKKSALFRSVIPSKIFESMAMERPILLGVAGESREIIDDAGCGIAVEPEDHEALAIAIRELHGDPARCERPGKRGRVYVEAHYDREALAIRFENAIATVIDARESV